MPNQNTADKFSVFFDETGLTITTSLSKAGGTFATVAPAITDAGNGYYIITPLAAHRDTLGVNSWLLVDGDKKRPYVELVTLPIPTAASIATAVWANATRTLSTISDSAGVATLLTRITGLLRTKAQADAAQAAIESHLPETGRAVTRAEIDAQPVTVQLDDTTITTNTQRGAY